MRAVLFVLFLLLPACSTFNKADDIETKAAAVYGQFVVAEEAAADIVCPNIPRGTPAPAGVKCAPTVPPGVVRAIASADSVAKPLADTLAAAARQYAAAKRELSAAGSQPAGHLTEAVSIGLQRLTAAYTEAAPSIQALISAVNQVKKGS